MITATLEGLNDAQSRITRMLYGVGSGMGNAIERVGERASDHLSMMAPYGQERDGYIGPHYRESIGYVTARLADDWYADVQSTGPKAFLTPIIRFGSAPHVIRATGQALAFEWTGGPSGPGTYFFKQVQHPGTRPNDFVQASVPAVELIASEELAAFGRIFLEV